MYGNKGKRWLVYGGWIIQSWKWDRWKWMRDE
jgi:hypothetical protein